MERKRDFSPVVIIIIGKYLYYFAIESLDTGFDETVYSSGRDVRIYHYVMSAFSIITNCNKNARWSAFCDANWEWECHGS